MDGSSKIHGEISVTDVCEAGSDLFDKLIPCDGRIPVPFYPVVLGIGDD